MAASRDLRSRVTNVVTCPICLELFNCPKSLPCLHTFCLNCIERHCRENEPGGAVACPVCRHEFNIPKDGAKGLVDNFFITDLVDARKTSSDVVKVPCEVCVLQCDGRPNSNVAESTMYCVDCGEKLCERCSRSHMTHRGRKGGSHKVVPIGNETEKTQVRKPGGLKCDKHKDDDIRLFCMECRVNICVMCVAEEHQQHKCKNVTVVAGEFVKHIDTDLVQVKMRVDGAQKELSRLDEERDKFLVGADDVVCKLQTKGEELIKQLIDAQVNELTLEVQSLKAETCKKIESLKDDVEMKLLMFETFIAYCNELKAKGKPCDITRAAKDLHNRAMELMQNEVTGDNYCAPAVTFTPMNIHELLDAGQNFIGKVTTNALADSKLTSSSVSSVTRSNKTPSQQSAECQQLRNSARDVKVKLQDTDKLVKTTVAKLERCNSELSRWQKTQNEVKRLSAELEPAGKRESFEGKQEAEQLTEKLLKEHREIVPRVVHTLHEAESVVGVTSMDDELYVLLKKDEDQVKIYNTTTNYSLVRRLSVPRVKYGDLCDMTSCKHYRCLYITDCRNCCVHRIDVNGKITKLLVSNQPNGLSVTSQFTLLVPCRDRKLLELTTEGKQLREINLQSDIVHPHHAIQLSNGQFVVCHGAVKDPLHRVCFVDNNGHVTQSYGGPRGSATVGQLHQPCHLAVDKDEFIFVADYNNSRVLLLSPTLKFVCEIVSRDQLKGGPERLSLDVDRRRLYVAVDREVVVVQL